MNEGNLKYHSSKDQGGQEIGEEAVGDISDEFGKLFISAVGPCGEEAEDQKVIYVHHTSHCAHLTVVLGHALVHSEVGTVAGEMHRYYHLVLCFLTTWPHCAHLVRSTYGKICSRRKRASWIAKVAKLSSFGRS